MIKVGQMVSVPWYRNGKRIYDLKGVIIHIDGAYHDIRIINHPAYKILELYPCEFTVIDE